MIRLVLGHDLQLNVVPIMTDLPKWTSYTTATGQEVGGYLLLATTSDPTKVLGTMGETGREGPSDGMLTIAAEQAVRHFPMHARVTAPEESKYLQPHSFDRDREQPGYVCKCGKDANTAIHGRG